MKFLIVLHGDESLMEQATPEFMQEIVAQMGAFNEELQKAGVLVDGQGLAPSSETTTLRYGADGDVVVTDGPRRSSARGCARRRAAVRLSASARAGGPREERRRGEFLPHVRE